MKKISLTSLLLFVSLFFFEYAYSQPSYVWDSAYGGGDNDVMWNMHSASNGDVLMVGLTKSSDNHVISGTDPDGSGHHGSNFYDDVWVIRINPMGRIVWQNALGGSSYDEAWDVTEASNGDILIAGKTNSIDGDVDPSTDPDSSGQHGSLDFWIIRLDSEGNLIWQNALGGSGGDRAISIIESKNGDIIACGLTEGPNSGDIKQSTDPDGEAYHGGLTDWWVVRLDSEGNLIWQNTLGGSNEEWAFDLIEQPNGNIVVAGFTASSDFDINPLTDPDGSGQHGFYDLWVVALSPSGNMIWQNALGGTHIDEARVLAYSPDNHIVIGGITVSTDGDLMSSTDPDGNSTHGSSDFWLVKLDTLGNLVWQNALGTELKEEEINTISFMPSDCNNDFFIYIAGGSHGSYSNGDKTEPNPGGATMSVWIVKLNLDGQVVWDKTFGSGGKDDHSNICINPEGELWVGATTNMSAKTIYDKKSPLYGANDFWLIKTEFGYSLDASFSFDTVCLGLPTTLINTSAPSWLDSSFRYQWEFQDKASNQTTSIKHPQYSFSDTGSYLVTLIVNADCEFDTIVDTILVEGGRGFALNQDTTICEGTEYLASVEKTWAVKYYWSNGDTNSTVSINEPGDYIITIKDIDSCMYSGNISLNVLSCDTNNIAADTIDQTYLVFIPNAISPDQDFNNESFDIIQKNILQYEVSIFNQWGDKVFEINEMNSSWDGAHNGKEVSGVHFYTFNGTTITGQHISLTGTITVIR